MNYWRCRQSRCGGALEQRTSLRSSSWTHRSEGSRPSMPRSTRSRRRSAAGSILILDNGGVIERAQQIAARLKPAQKPLVIDVKAERLRGGIEVGTVNEQREFFFVRGHEFSLVIET